MPNAGEIIACKASNLIGNGQLGGSDEPSPMGLNKQAINLFSPIQIIYLHQIYKSSSAKPMVFSCNKFFTPIQSFPAIFL